jgi:excinuclease UvrABC nuclease subunit
MNQKIRFLSLMTLACVLILTSGCSAPKPAGLTDEQVASVTENTLKALEANDYQAFTQDFSDQMNQAFTQEQFTKLEGMLQSASGKFVSLGKPTLSNNQGYAVYRFPAKYENETVYVTITFLVGGQKIEGEFFDSVNLRKQAQ